MSIALIINIALGATVAVTVVGGMVWSIVSQGREARVATAAAWARPLAMVVAVAGCLAVLASPAAAATGGTISGTVTDTAASPAPVDNICVEVLKASTGSQVGFTDTDPNGHYTVANLPTGPYKVHFTDCTGKGYVDEYYNNKTDLATATAVSVTAPATTTGINAKMVLGAKITGTVKSHAGQPLANMCVAADSAPGMVSSEAHTNAVGQYVIRGLATGSYKVDVWDCAGTDYVEQYYSNQTSYNSAKPVAVTAPAVTSGIDALLYLGGKVTGTVTNNAAAPAPLADECVSVLTTSGTFVMGAETPASGQYSIAGVPVGTYKVAFYDCSGGDYVPQYYNNKPSFAAGNTISVTKGATTAGISAKMVPAGKIGGTVTNTAAAPLAHMCVDALNAATGAVIENAVTNASGQYTIGSLAAGSYKVEFTDCGPPGYIAQYYKNQSTFAAANPVAVTSGVTTTGIGAKMVHS